MNIVTDTDILFDSIKTRNPENILTRLRSVGHDIFVPLTVLGEVMLVGCLSEPNRKDELIDVMEYCQKIEPSVLIPNIKLRKCCQCIDEIAERNGITDRTNLGYATAYNTKNNHMDYYVTTDKPVLHIKLPCKTKCCLTPPEIVSPEQLRRTLLTK
jgi:hypothetical protein